MNLTYKLTDKKLDDEGDIKDQIIEKYGYVPTFTLGQLETNIEYTKKQMKEVKGMIDLNAAKKSNYEEHHPFIMDMSDFDRYTVHAYQEAFAMVKVATQKFDELQAQLDADQQEIDDIKAQIPELANIPSPFVPEAPKVADQPTEAPSNEQENEAGAEAAA